MEITVTATGDCTRQIDIEVPFHDIQPHIDKAYARYQKKVSIAGFRKGKIPISLLKKQFGDAIRAEVVEDLVQHYFSEAVKEKELPIVAPGSVKDVQFEENRPFRITAEVEVEPDVAVSDYTGFTVEKDKITVSREEVDHTLDLIREEKAEARETDDGAKTGDIVTGDVQALDGSGVPVIGQKWEARSFEIGKPPVGDMLAGQFDGLRSGDERRFSITQPPDEEGGAAQIDHYSISVSKVEEKILPALDDAFAASLGGYASLADLKENIRQRITSQREEESERALRFRISDEIIKRNDVTLPESMVKNVLDSMYEEHLQQSGQQSRKPLERSQFDGYQAPQVRWNLKWHLIGDKIAEQEGISVSDEELEAEISKLIVRDGAEDKKLKAWFKNPENARRLRDSMRDDKLMAFLRERVKIKEVTPKKRRDTQTPGGRR
ncbi:trigger factor [bacterium]|nr:trigger factor [bacterium]